MADAGASGDVAKAIGDPLGTLAALLKAVTPEGPVQTALSLVLGLCVALAPFIFRYYLGVLAQGAAPEGSLERQDYDKLRAGRKGQSRGASLCEMADRFPRLDRAVFWRCRLSEQDAVSSTLPHAFGLKKPAPLWTAPAFAL